MLLWYVFVVDVLTPMHSQLLGVKLADGCLRLFGVLTLTGLLFTEFNLCCHCLICVAIILSI